MYNRYSRLNNGGKVMEEDNTFGLDFFVPMFLILAKTFFITFPFVSDEKYMHNFADNFSEVSGEIFDKLGEKWI